MFHLRLVVAACFLALLFITAGPPATAEVEENEAWDALQKEVDAAFRPLPVGQMFGDPDRELKRSRRAPYTAAARDEIAKDRAKAHLRRAQIADERRKREEIVLRIGKFEDARAARLLMDTYENQLAEIDRAQKVVDLHEEAAKIDINPGVDPGGVYWERWLGKERGAAKGILRDEKKVRDLALEGCRKLLTPEIRRWFVRNASDHERVEVRDQMIESLAASGDPQLAASLGGLIAKEGATWARVMILDAIARNKSPGAAQFVLGALADKAWPVRSVAIDALRALKLRDAAAIDALLAAMERSDGRLRLEIRDALSEATGRPFGLEPGEWKLWWGQKREEWVAPEQDRKVTPLAEKLPLVFGVPTASKRIAILLARGRGMRSPVKRRPLANNGEPSPPPAIDTTYRVAVWELSQALESLPDKTEFVVVVFGAKAHPSAKKLRKLTKDTRAKAVALAARFEADGGTWLGPALEVAMRMGLKGRVADLALGDAGDVDTLFIVGAGSWRDPGLVRLRRLRRVDIHLVNVANLPKLAEQQAK